MKKWGACKDSFLQPGYYTGSSLLSLTVLIDNYHFLSFFFEIARRPRVAQMLFDQGVCYSLHFHGVYVYRYIITYIYIYLIIYICIHYGFERTTASSQQLPVTCSPYFRVTGITTEGIRGMDGDSLDGDSLHNRQFVRQFCLIC